MKIDVEKYLSPAEAAEALGHSRRALYRTTARAEAAGHEVRVKLFGRTLYLARAIETLKKFHFDMHDQSPAAIKRRRAWGSKGGYSKRRRRGPEDFMTADEAAAALGLSAEDLVKKTKIAEAAGIQLRDMFWGVMLYERAAVETLRKLNG